jgi:heme exporter protein D
MAEFFEMGGYAAFVWPAYGITALVTLGLIVWTVQAHRAARQRVAALEAHGRRDNLPGSHAPGSSAPGDGA